MKIDIEKEQIINDHRDKLISLIKQAQKGIEIHVVMIKSHKALGLGNYERGERYIRYVSQRLKTLQAQYVESLKIVG